MIGNKYNSNLCSLYSLQVKHVIASLLILALLLTSLVVQFLYYKA